jgi:hypothetical protein
MHPGLRASDTERHAVAEQLAGHTAAGRLTLDEFDSRVRSAWAAQTRADLHRLLADLPAPISTAPIPASQARHLELVAIVLAVLVAVLGLAVPAIAGGTMPGCM